MSLARHLLAVAAVTAAVGVTTALPAAAAARQPATHKAVAGPAMCLDASNSRANGTRVYQWQCLANNNQIWVIDHGLIKLQDTIGTSREVCLDATNDRFNGTQVYLWQCVPNTNQIWVVKRGELIMRDTLVAARPMCLDSSNARGNGVLSYLWQCLSNNNQKWVIDNGMIK